MTFVVWAGTVFGPRLWQLSVRRRLLADIIVKKRIIPCNVALILKLGPIVLQHNSYFLHTYKETLMQVALHPGIVGALYVEVCTN